MARKKRLTLEQKRQQKKLSQKDASKNSRYSRKRKFLDKNGGMGKDYPHKPWK